MFENIYGLKTNKIINYVNKYDPIGMANAENNFGDTYEVPSDSNKNLQHYLKDMGPLNERQYRTPALHFSIVHDKCIFPRP